MMRNIFNGTPRVLVLAPHTDDAELGCGGTMARLLGSGAEVAVAAFSVAEESLPPGSNPDRLHCEFLRAMGILGVDAERTFVYDYPVRRFSDHRQEVLEQLVQLRRQLEPEVVFVTSSTDLHQDHQVLHNETVRAFKEATLWCYELPWNSMNFTSQAFVVLNQEHLDRKWAALQAYESQLELQRPYFNKEFIQGLARVRGVQVRTQYAEVFEVVRVKW
jgi:LmbE family N-acetylglucosaminyl deacetylase